MTTPSQALTKPPVFDDVPARQIALLKSTVAKGATDPELATFLELARKYDLDPFAHEVWCAISQRDGGNRNVLIMVGRAGLRKIAQRQGYTIDGDVHRERDVFRVTRNQDGTRWIFHEYEEADDKSRGAIRGAWCEVRNREGKQVGYFYAPLSEYKPTNPNKLKYSPWGSQESTMILAAAERQAIAMATPLGGLHVESEAVAPVAEEVTPTLPEDELPPEAQLVLDHAQKVGHAQLSDSQTVAMMVSGMPAEELARWASDAHKELNGMTEGEKT
jgi:RecT family